MKSIKDKLKNISFPKEDLTKKNVIQGAVIRPIILMIAFFVFILGMFLLVGSYQSPGLLKWAGSAILFSFILNLEGIYLTFVDKPSFFRTMNLIFKLVLFIAEIIAFNYILVM